jgi:hypothetical protein
VNAATLVDVPPLDFKSPFDELRELRELLTAQEIADLTGLRRETISRARPDSRFQQRTEKALGDLYLVVRRMRSVADDDLGQLAAVLRRPQDVLDGRSIAALLREGRADVVLDRLSPTVTSEEEALANLQLDPAVEAQLTPWKDPPEGELASDPGLEERVATVLAADSELASRLGAIEAAIISRFGPETQIERKIVGEFDESEGDDELYLRVHTDLPIGQEMDLLAEFLRREEDLLAPVRRQLVIGFLG